MARLNIPFFFCGHRVFCYGHLGLCRFTGKLVSPLLFIMVVFSLVPLSGCSWTGATWLPLREVEEPLAERGFLPSGSIVVSSIVPITPVADLAAVERPTLDGVSPAESSVQTSHRLFAPLVAFVPPVVSLTPASNETWLEIDRSKALLRVFTGTSVDLQIQAEGQVSLPPGSYPLLHKQRSPLWYAPDAYFKNRHLSVPPPGDRLRYLRGALGEFALFPRDDFPIHSSPLWSDEVGGLRVSQEEFLEIYYRLDVGSVVVVR